METTKTNSDETTPVGVGCIALVGAELSNRISGYLISGGMWNPEMALHDRVRDLLIECREYIDGTLASDRNAPTVQDHRSLREAV